MIRREWILHLGMGFLISWMVHDWLWWDLEWKDYGNFQNVVSSKTMEDMESWNGWMESNWEYDEDWYDWEWRGEKGEWGLLFWEEWNLFLRKGEEDNGN